MIKDDKCFVCGRLLDEHAETVETEDGHVCLQCAGEFEPEGPDSEDDLGNLAFNEQNVPQMDVDY
jgi:hypothetical protein